MDNSSLLAEYVRTRDPSLFKALTDQYQPMVQRICRRQLGNDADAQEATQEFFRALFVHAADIRSNLGGWLFKTSLNTARATQRSNLSRNKRELANAIPVNQVDSTNHKSELTEVVDVCLAALEPEAYSSVSQQMFLEMEALSWGLVIQIRQAPSEPKHSSGQVAMV